MKYLLFFLISIPALASPDWVQSAPTRIGNALQVACHGSGPDDSTAFKSALNECRDIASQTLLQNFQVKDLTIQTERDSAYHSEILHQMSVEGLQCTVKHVYGNSEDKWILCWFDTSKTKVTPVVAETSETLFNKEEKYVVLVVAPACDSILVIGPTPRIIRCQQNPITVVVRPGDEELVVRHKGYAPKHIAAKQWQTTSAIPVYLDRL